LYTMVITKALLLIFLIGGTYIQKTVSIRSTYTDDACKEKATTCFGIGKDDHDNCMEKHSCKLFVIILKVKTGYQFKLYAREQYSYGYFAVGLSSEGIGMKDVAVVACTPSPSFQPYWTTDTKASAVTMVPSEDLIVEGSERYGETPARTYRYCEFVLKRLFTISNTTPPYPFDLDTKKYKILLAFGNYDHTANKIKYHNADRKLSTKMFDLKNASVSNSSMPALFLMTIVTWLLCYLHH